MVVEKLVKFLKRKKHKPCCMNCRTVQFLIISENQCAEGYYSQDTENITISVGGLHPYRETCSCPSVCLKICRHKMII